jgi:hypothetical protein
MSWSVRWTLMESAIPAEITRLAAIFPEDPPELIERHARYDKSRSFDTRVKAEWHIKSLKKQRIASSIVLRHFDPKGNDRTGMFWEIPQPHDAMPADPFKLISGTTQDGNPFYQIDGLLIQRNRNGEWHAFDRCIWQAEFPSEKSARRWLNNNAPKAPKLLPPRFASIPAQPVTPQPEKVNICSPNPQSIFNPQSSIGNPIMKSNLTPESDFPSTSSLLSSVSKSSVSDLFSFRNYQREDLARAAMHDGAVIGWEPGMGKTMAIFTLPFLRHSRFVLLVAPEGLHEQIMDEGREKFGVNVTPIPNQQAAYTLMREGILPLPGHQDPNSSSLPSSVSPSSVSAASPQFFITSYTQLGYNGADEWNPDESNELLRGRRLTILCANQSFPDAALAKRMAAMTWNPKKKSTPWEKLSLPEGSSEESIRTALRTAARLFHPSLHSGDATMHWRFTAIANAAMHLLKTPEGNQETMMEAIKTDPLLLTAQEALASIEKGIGTEREIGNETLDIRESSSSSPISNLQSPISIRCVFHPTLASLLCHIFDCVICDEAVRIKSGTSYQAQGVLRMYYARSRYVLTGTPIKNKLPDLFFLASFVTGHTKQARARWPYGNDTADRYRFASDFGVLEENLTKGEQAQKNGKRQPPPKTTNQICNVHRLWRILLPVIIRRRKDDVEGCDIPPKTIVPIRVMPGTHQQRAYKYALDRPEAKASLLATIGAQLQCLRQAALNPSTSKLRKESRSPNPWTPKAAGIFQLATDLMAQGEQLVIFSPFQDFSTLMASRFAEAGIPCLKLDGNTSGSKRGSNIKKFKSGEIPILIAGIDSMGEGHSLDNCCHLVLPSLSWAFDSNSQAVDRVHRLTSKKPVTIYVMVTKGTIDERLASIWQEKGDSSDLALDGRLTTQDRDEIDLGQLLRDAVEDFDPLAETLDEDQVSAQWKSTLCPALTTSYKAYRKARPIPAEGLKRSEIADRSIKPSPAKPDSKPTIHNPQSTIPAPPRPTSLFDLMKQKRNNQQPPATPPPAPPAPPAPPQSAIENPQSSISNIIPFPGALGRLTSKPPIENRQSSIDNRPTSPPFRRVSIAEILRS